MMNITKTDNTKNAVEIRKELQANCTSLEYIEVEGKRLGILGSVSEKDKQNAIKAIQSALDASDGNVYEMMRKLETIATIDAKEINPDEMIEVCGQEVMISYESKKAYDINGEEIANCDDLTSEMPDEAIKAILVARVESLLG